jgi:hypothetical protein
MKRSSAFLFTATLFLVVSAQARVRADFVSWSYNWTPSAIALPADVPGTGGLSLTNEPTKNADGWSDIVVTNIRGFSSASRSNSDKFTHAGYTFMLVLTDLGSGQSAHMSFTGFFSGTLSATSSNIANTFTGATTETATLGGHTYMVSLGNYSPPGPPTASNSGSISAHVSVDQFLPPPPIPPSEHAPEPSTLLLSCVGLVGVCATAWRKWRRSV